MYSGRCAALLLFILVQADGYILDNVECTYNFKQTCLEDVNNYKVIGYNPSVINYCTAEDVPHIKFVVNKSGSLNIMFAPPKKECGFGVALLVNPLIKNERECEEYKFEVNDINSKVHTIESALCILRDTNQLVRYNNSLCEDNIRLWFEYIFTGCYALQFHIGRQKYVIRDQVFLHTTYQLTRVTEPQFICKYDTYSNLDQRHKITNFTLDTWLPIDTGYLLEVMLISPQNKTEERGCVWVGGPHIGRWKINLLVTNLKEALDNVNCSVKSMRTVSGEYMKTLQCNFQVQTTQTADYCFIFRVSDDRCHENTIWNPLNTNTTPCTWIKRCTNTSLHTNSVETVKSDKLPNANLYLLLRIIATVLVVLAIVVILCFWHLCIRKKEVTLYVNPQHDDFLNSVCFESTDLSIVDNNDSEKEIDHDNLSCNDIVLLYTKNSMSFMALMKDFRETLAKMCSCSVYDWYEEAEWNDVAKVGPVSWFTKLLNGRCRAVWIDTPTTRSIVISRENDLDLNKLDKYYAIGDFRDMAFPVVLELAKRNINDAVHQYRRHFVVRFEGLESMANVKDPFMDLSPHARYRMPQHLAQLCLDLSMVKPVIPRYQLKAEENLLQQRLRLAKMESIM